MSIIRLMTSNEQIPTFITELRKKGYTMIKTDEEAKKADKQPEVILQVTPVLTDEQKPTHVDIKEVPDKSVDEKKESSQPAQKKEMPTEEKTAETIQSNLKVPGQRDLKMAEPDEDEPSANKRYQSNLTNRGFGW